MLPAHFGCGNRPLVYAHRGASADAPENTLAAFRLALEQSADGIELDAQRCASGEVVVVHDESLLRTTGHDALVTRTSWSALRGLDAGAWKAQHFRGERVPLLAEVLEAFPRLVNVELKCETANDGGLTAEVVRIVRDAGAADRVLLSSFNPLCLWRARLRAPRIARALLFERDQRWVLRSGLSAPAVGALALHPEHVLATAERVAHWRKRGYSVGCWTVDDPDLAARLYQSGVGAFITNRPSLLRARFPG
jgi:glycerophosphoryl diester phosphodiesterase